MAETHFLIRALRLIIQTILSHVGQNSEPLDLQGLRRQY